MTALHKNQISEWIGGPQQAAKRDMEQLESGKILFFPNLKFNLLEEEKSLLSPDTTSSKAKNICYDSKKDQLKGTDLMGLQRQSLQNMMQRFSSSANSLLLQVLPEYNDSLMSARTSFRTIQIKGRQSSSLKDDTQLHCDSFPSTPTQGNRILRVFTNINPNGESRKWRVGSEPFSKTAERFWNQMSPPFWGSHTLMDMLGITRGRRSDYDHYMLCLHNLMKSDPDYQRDVPQEAIDLPPNSSWIVYTDQVPHAVMAGQYVLEQTFHLPVAGMYDPAKSPLCVLEKLAARKLT
ncbi:MAG: Kdo hydroxylase family protein [Pseudomonadota bacterium]